MTRLRRSNDPAPGAAATSTENAPDRPDVMDGLRRLEHVQVEDLVGVHPRRHRGVEKTVQMHLGLAYRELVANGRPLPSLTDAEVRFYSQNGEDGIVQLLLAAVGTATRKTVEICAGDGVECNSANLIVNHGWTGLLVDGGDELVTRGRRFYEDGGETWYWPPTLVQSWVTRENVNQLVTDAGFSGDIDLLTIDLDGVDYWIWDALTCVRARIVIVEFNAGWGPTERMTVPYADDFAWEMGSQYFGASLAALIELARTKGYRYVGTNSYAFNAFFVRDDLGLDALPTADPHDAFRHPSALRSAERLDKVKHLPWVNV